MPVVPRARTRVAVVAVTTALAVLSGGLTTRAAIAEPTRRHARELPALESTAAPADRPSIPQGDFRNPPPRVRPSQEHPAFSGFDPLGSTVASRTTTRTVYNNPDGSQTARVHSAPANFKDASGTWRAIDTTVRTGPEGDLRNTAGPVDYTFGTATGASDLVGIAGEDWRIGFSLEGQARGRTATTSGSLVTYPGVAPNTDLTYHVEPDALKETVVLRRPPASSSDAHYRFPLTLDGLRASAEDGGVTFTDTDGEIAARIPAGLAWDSAARPAEAPVTVGLTDRNGRAVIELTVDGVWLTDPKRVYPVFIDPTIYPGNTTSRWDSYVQNATPTSNHSTSTINRFGKQSTTTYRSFIKFALPDLSTETILSAKLKHFISYAASGTAQTYGLNAVQNVSSGGSWTAEAVTWNTQPAVRSPAIQDTTTTGWRTVDILPWMANWASGAWENNGFRFQGSESSTSGYKESASAQYADSTKRPYLEVTYNAKPPVPEAVGPEDEATAFTSTPTLEIEAFDDPDAGQSEQYFFRVSTIEGGFNGQIVDSGWLTSPSWTVPAGTLENGATYYWRAWTYDGIAMTWSDWDRSFTVDEVGSSGPSDTVGPATVSLSNGNLSVGVASPSYPSVGGDIGFSYHYNSLDGAAHGLTATFYDDSEVGEHDFADAQQLTSRVDRHLNYYWGGWAPAARVPYNDFLIRWEGKLTVPTTGSYFFGAASDDGVKISVNGATVLDRWFDQTAGAPVYGSSVNLTAFQPVNITVEYYDDDGVASFRLAAKGPGIPNDVTVPSDWLTPPDSSLPHRWTLSDDGPAYIRAIDAGDAVVLAGPDGSTTEYARNADGAFTPPEGDSGVLAADQATGKLTLRADGMVYVFADDGHLESAQSTNEAGAAAPVSEWSGSPTRLRSVTDPISGRQVTLEYGGGSCPARPDLSFDENQPANMLCRITYWDGKQTHLFYSLGLLARIQDPGGAVMDFGYTAGELTKIRDQLASDAVAAGIRTDDDTTWTQIVYAGDRVASVELPTGVAGAPRGKSTYSYWPNQAEVDITGITGSAGYARRVSFDDGGNVTEDRGPDGLGTVYEYDEDGNLLSAQGPTGHRSTTIYDDQGRPTDSYGPAPSSWFDLDEQSPSYNTPLSQHADKVAHEHTAYDEDMQGLAVSYWSNDGLVGQPDCHDTGIATDGSGVVNRTWSAELPDCLEAGTTDWSARLTGEILLPDAGGPTPSRPTPAKARACSLARKP